MPDEDGPLVEVYIECKNQETADKLAGLIDDALDQVDLDQVGEVSIEVKS